jgi:hypothetical protein
VISFILQMLGIAVPEEEVSKAVEQLLIVVGTIGQLVGIIVAWYGRYRQGDVKVIGVRKD